MYRGPEAAFESKSESYPKNFQEIEEEKRLTSEEKIERLAGIRNQAIRMANRTFPIDIAEEAVSEAYFKAVKYIDAFRHESTLSTWFFHIVMREALRHIKEQNPRQKDVPIEEYKTQKDGEFNESLPNLSGGDNPEQALINKQVSQRLMAEVDKLPKKQRQAIISTEFEGISHEAAAVLTQTTASSHRNHKQKGIRKLREKLKGKNKFFGR